MLAAAASTRRCQLPYNGSRREASMCNVANEYAIAPVPRSPRGPTAEEHHRGDCVSVLGLAARCDGVYRSRGTTAISGAATQLVLGAAGGFATSRLVGNAGDNVQLNWEIDSAQDSCKDATDLANYRLA